MKGTREYWDKKGLLKCLLAVVFMITAIVGFANSKSIMNYAKQFFAAGDVPAHEKTRTDNTIDGVKDGTYKIGLTVTGDAEKKVQKVNVIVIVDRSNSMDSGSGTGAYVASNENASTMYGFIDGEYRLLRRSYSGGRWHYSYSGTEYTGQRYIYDTTASRLEATKAAVNGLASSLLSNNGKDGNPNDTVEMALVTFASTAQTNITKTSTISTYVNAVNGISTPGGWAGGTNWEAALDEANDISFGDTDPTYVIFFSDGAPTFRNTQAGFNDRDNRAPTGVYGSGQEEEPNMERAYDQATDDAATLATKVGVENFYTIFAYGETYGATYMTNLTTAAGAPAGNNYSASNTVELEEAFAQILSKIEMAGIGAVQINDGTTNKVSTSTGVVSLLEVDESSYKYYKTNKETGQLEEWTDPENDPDLQAKLQANGTVKWDLSKLGVLENDVTYKVTFDVYPSQTTYDYIAELENGTRTYESLPSEVRQYLKRTGTELSGYSYSLETNTTASLSYTDTRTGESKTVGYDNPPAVPTTADKISISKGWDNSLDAREKREVGVKLLRSEDGENYEDFCFTTTCDAKLNSGNNWSIDDIYIATGLARVENGVLEVLDAGHDYKFAELGSESYYWELETEVVHPMIVNGTLTKLILIQDESQIPEMDGNYKKDGSTEYFKLNGKVYVATGDDPSIKAENNRRSNLNITKTVDGPTADPDDEFTFNIKVVEKDADGKPIVSSDTVNHNDYLWFSVQDADGNAVTLSPTPEGWTQSGTSYYAPNQTPLTVKLKAGENLRFFNLHSGTTFDVTETDIDDYSLVNIKETEERKTPQEGVDPEDWPTTSKDIQTVTTSTLSGTILENNRSYVVNATNKYEKVNAKVKKEWYGDNDGAEGLRKSIKFDLKNGSTVVDSITLDGVVDEVETTSWYGEFEEQPRYSGGQEITYTIEEDLTNIEGHYESSVSGSANEGLVTVTNTRIPEDETTTVSGEKTWQDNDDQDGVRPTSITVRLYADGDEVDHTTVSVDPDTGDWKYTFTDLPKYKAGELIVYTITEDIVTNYETDYEDDDDGNPYNIINKHTPFTTTIKVTKVWNDNNDQDGKRPASIEVQLLKAGVALGDKVTLNDDNNWTYTWDSLPRKAGGQDIVYTVIEVPAPPTSDYTFSYDKIDASDEEADESNTPEWVITNTHTPEPTEVSVTKVWDDANDQDGIRPDSVTVQLYADGTATGDPVTLNEDNSWTFKWTGLDKYKDKSEIDYTVDESPVPTGYTREVTGSQEDGYTITNKHTPEVTTVSVTKAWDDADDQDGIRPDDVTIQLYADGTATGDPVTLNEDNSWTYTWTGLAKNKNVDGDGVAIVYTVDETPVPSGYTHEVTGSQADGYTVTNKHTPGVTTVSVTKAWDDADDQDGIRPDDIDVQLYADGTAEGAVVTLNEDNSWTYTWSDLPVNKAGTPIEYTVDETAVPEGYAKTITGDADAGFTITNKHVPEVTTIKVTKAWDDADDQDGIRPDDVDVQLYADGVAEGAVVTLNEDNSWTYTWSDLPVNKGGEKIAYTVDETAVPEGYTKTITGDAAAGFTITNKHVPEVTTIKVTKAWDDADDQDGIRPDDVDVQLYANGTAEGVAVTLNEDNSWTYTWSDLPVNKDGEKITYTVDETAVPEGYAKTITGDAAAGFTITNKHVPEVTTIKVTKAWDDADDQDGIRPDDVDVQLYANGTAEGVAVTLNEDNSWTYTWSDLPVNKDGEKITYTVDETAVPTGYAKTITGDAAAGFTITNKHVPEVISIKVTKAWVDNDDQDGIRPDSIDVQLSADGTAEGDPVTLDEDNSWTYTWTGLDKFKDGEEITYTVDETEVPDGYTKDSITGDVTVGFTIKNVHVTEETAVKVTKAWADNDDQDGIRPDDIDVQLYADGKAEGDPVTLDESNKWTYTWSGLDKFKDGEEIEYTVDETAVPTDYTKAITGEADTGYTITNTHEPEKTTVSGNKTWDDSNNQDGLRPETITINLYADGKLVNSKDFPVDPETGECNYSFTTDSNGVDLPKYRDGGTAIVYTITEDRVSDYEEPDYDDNNPLNVTNKHNPFETEVSVKKNWNDAEDIDGMRPKSITVRLWADDIPYSGSTTVTLDESNNWSYTWSGLPRKASGQDIVYTVKELVVPDGYTSNVDDPEKELTPTTTPDGTTYIVDEAIGITNNHTPEETEVSVEKVWKDSENQDGLRPVSVNVKLLADGKEAGSITLSEQNNWKYTWTELPKYEFKENGEGGKEIEYTVEETEVPDKYTAEVSGNAAEGFTVTNKYTPEETSLKVTKAWDDQGDQDGIRPTSITVQLTADGTAQGAPVTLDESNNWTYTWTGLAKNKNVQGSVSAITYKADEVEVPQGYTKSVTGDMTTGITITNKYTPKVTNVEGTKTWDDSNNIDGKRPSSITVYVKDGDKIVDTITVTGDATAESWTFKSKDLPQYRNHGKEEIEYTIEEETTGLVEIGYSVEIDGTNITNSRTPEVIEEFPITKSWIDNSNSEGFRPNSVDIQLLADGKPYGEPITIGTDKDGNPLKGTTIEGNNWKYVFKNLPKYTHDADGNGGKEIVYSIKEVNLDANYKAEQVDNRTIVNTIDAMKKDIPVKKVWDDASNQDGYRPDSIEFTLTGTVESETEPVYTDKITLNGETDTWEGKFVEAPIFYKGTLITYTVNEVVTKDLQTYYPETKEETVEGVYTITNKHVPEVTEVTIGKTWDDKDDQDGKRPASIEVTLTGNGKSYGPVRIGLDENGNPLEGTTVKGNTWTYTFTGLPKKANGKDIEYVVSESNVDNYNQLSIISNVITNQHIPATISYEVVKQWEDYDNQDGKRPEFITVTLTGKVGDTVVYTSTITVKPDENGDWKYAFTGLDKYNKGQLIQYTLTEGNVDLYETDPIVDVPNEEGTTTINNTIINRHELETIDITVKKVWDDLDNKYNHRTTFVTVHLFADGEEIDEAMLTEANGWTTIFEGLVKYREGKVGEEIEYTITEDAVNYYKTSIAESDNVFTITNTYDGPTESEIVPPKTGILPTKDYTFYELLMNLILLSYSLICLKKLED